MQTFLPFESFKRTAEVLDQRRLWKQVIEAKTILNVIEKKERGETKVGWGNHPAVIMWQGHSDILKIYYNIMLLKSLEIGIKAKMELLGFTVRNISTDEESYIGVEVLRVFSFNNTIDFLEKIYENSKKPVWLGNREFHLSHQSNLLRKNFNHYEKFFDCKNSDLPYIWPKN